MKYNDLSYNIHISGKNKRSIVGGIYERNKGYMPNDEELQHCNNLVRNLQKSC